MAAKNLALSNQEIGPVSKISLHSTFERMARMRRGNQPQITSIEMARALVQQTRLQITTHAFKAVSAQASFDRMRIGKLLEA